MTKATTFPQKVLCCIPLIFGVQQFFEGIEWRSLTHPGMSLWHEISTYAFLVFAQVVWPMIVPVSVWLLEKNKGIKKVLGVTIALGFIVSAYLAYSLLFFKVQSTISCSHIRYDVAYPHSLKHFGIFYFIVTVIPPVISSINRLRLLGVTIFISYIVTRIFYEDYLVSVWCFFAAIISVVVLSVIVQLNKASKTVPGILPV